MLSVFEKNLDNARSLSNRKRNYLNIGAMDSARRLTPMANAENKLRDTADISITTEYIPINNYTLFKAERSTS